MPVSVEITQLALRTNAHSSVSAGQSIGEIDKGGSSNRNQHVGAKAGAALAILPLRPDQRAEHEGNREADQRVEKIKELKCLDELHGRDLEAAGGNILSLIYVKLTNNEYASLAAPRDVFRVQR